jgi:hypothetical protein
MRQGAVQRILRQIRNGLQESKWDFGANDRGGLEEPFLFGWQPVGAWFSAQRPALYQGTHALLEEKRIALGAGDQQPFQSL